MKHKRRKILLLLIFIGFVMFTGCDYNYLRYPAPAEVNFSDDIIPIFDKSCNMSGCHNGSGPSPDLTPANAYVDLFANNLIDTIAPESSKLYIKLVGPGTHDGRSDGTQRNYILAWIQQGAKEN